MLLTQLTVTVCREILSLETSSRADTVRREYVGELEAYYATVAHKGVTVRDCVGIGVVTNDHPVRKRLWLRPLLSSSMKVK